MRLWLVLIGVVFSGSALAQDDPVEDKDGVEKSEPDATAEPDGTDGDGTTETVNENPSQARPKVAPKEMTPERKAKAEYWEQRRIKEAKEWHGNVKRLTDEWLATSGLEKEVSTAVRSAVTKMLETDNMIRGQMRAGEIKAKEGRGRLLINRGAAAEAITGIAGESKMKALRAHLTSVGGAF